MVTDTENGPSAPEKAVIEGSQDTKPRAPTAPKAKQARATEPKSKAARKKVPPKAERERRLDMRVIKLLVKENPKRAGSKAHVRFKKYRNGMRVHEAQAAGLGADLTYDAAHKYISISKA